MDVIKEKGEGGGSTQGRAGLQLVFACFTFWLLIAQESIEDTCYHAKSRTLKNSLIKRKKKRMQCIALFMQPL